MARLFRFLGKKRGSRQTGSRLVGSLGEALFFGGLFLLGSVTLTALVMAKLNESTTTLSFGFGFWLIVAVLGSFVMIGGAGLVYALLSVGTSAERRSALARRAASMELISEAVTRPKDFPSIPSDVDQTNSPGIKLAFRLPAAHSPVWQLSAATAFCVVWNGVTAVIAVITMQRFPSSLTDWLIAVSLPLFLAVGVWSVNHFIRQLLLYTGIGPTIVEVSAHPLYPGQPYQVFVSQSGRLEMKVLEMFLVCEEEATYQQGTDIRTDYQVVHEHLVFRREKFTIERGAAFEYQCVFSVPEGTMHSFQSPHNRIQWKLVAKGESTSWPPFVRSFPVVVYPAQEIPSLVPRPHIVEKVNV